MCVRISELGRIIEQLRLGDNLTYPTLVKIGGFHHIIERTASQRYKMLTGYWPIYGATK